MLNAYTWLGTSLPWVAFLFLLGLFIVYCKSRQSVRYIIIIIKSNDKEEWAYLLGFGR